MPLIEYQASLTLLAIEGFQLACLAILIHQKFYFSFVHIMKVEQIQSHFSQGGNQTTKTGVAQHLNVNIKVGLAIQSGYAHTN